MILFVAVECVNLYMIIPILGYRNPVDLNEIKFLLNV